MSDAAFVVCGLLAVVVSGAGCALYEHLYWKRRKALEWPFIEHTRIRNTGWTSVNDEHVYALATIDSSCGCSTVREHDTYHITERNRYGEVELLAHCGTYPEDNFAYVDAPGLPVEETT